MSYLLLGANSLQNPPSPTATITGSLNQTQPAQDIGVTLELPIGSTPSIVDASGNTLAGWSIALDSGSDWDITPSNVVGSTDFLITADNLWSAPLNQSQTFVLSALGGGVATFINDTTAEAAFPAGTGGGAGTLLDPTSDFDAALAAGAIGSTVLVVSKGAYTTAGFNLVSNLGVGHTSVVNVGPWNVDDTTLVAMKTGASELTRYPENFIPASLVNDVNGVTTTTPSLAEIQAAVDVMCITNLQGLIYNATDDASAPKTLEYRVSGGTVAAVVSSSSGGGGRVNRRVVVRYR